MSVHVHTLGIVHKEQCYNDSDNLWFTVIGYQFMNCLCLLLIHTQATLWSSDHRLHGLCWYCHHYAAVVDMCGLSVHLYVGWAVYHIPIIL